MNSDQAYQRYVDYCASVDSKPMERERWEKFRHNTSTTGRAILPPSQENVFGYNH